MAEKIRWGILGTGSIAGKFAAGLGAAAGAELAAVGSRKQSTADAFAERWGVPRRHGSYEALAADGDVDVIYVATPHSLHAANSILCLRAGKAVLCEKPFTINAAQAEEVVAVARRERLFLMEAMWSRFLPTVVRLRELLAAGRVGQVRMVAADFGFRARFDPSSRLFDPRLGGGGLLDVGVYAVSLASMVLGPPGEVAALAEMGQTGVDEQAGMLLKSPSGQLAVLYTGVRTGTPQEATVLGTEGMIRLESPWWHGRRLTVRAGGEEERIELGYEGNGYNCQAVEVMECLRAGKTESDVMGLDETLSIMRTLDAIRAQWGLKYPME